MQKNKKLLFVISSLEGSGGAERALTNRINYLVENYNYDITVVITLPGANTNSFYPLHDKVKLKMIPIDFAKNSFKQKILTLFPSKHIEEKPLLNFINEEGFDICTSFGAETLLYDEPGFIRFIKIKEHRFTYKRLLRYEGISPVKKLWRRIRFSKNIKIQKQMDYIISLTEEDAEFWRNYVKKVYVFPNFIDLKKITVSTLVSKNVIAVGRLEQQKDFESLIKAFSVVAKKFPDWILNIYGDGSLRSSLNKQIFEEDLQNNVFIHKPTKNIYEEYTCSSIYVHTAHYEGFPNTMLEAVGHGLPIVAFESVGGVKVLVKNNNNGFLIKNRSIKELSERISELISNDVLKREFSKNSTLLSHNYSVENIMEQWHEFYQNAV